jgi:glycosyltransferase involved in cell wall biosynthesis
MERGPGLPSSPGASDDIHSTDPWATISDRLGVLQVVPDLGPNGPARAAVDVAVGAVAAGGRAVVVSAGGRLVADLLRCGATHIVMPLAGDNALGRWTNVRRLMKLIREHRISIIHTHVPSAAWLAKKAAQETGAIYTLTCHSLYPPETFAELRRNGVLEGAQRVIAVSETAAEHLASRHRLPGGRPLVITPGIDLPRFDPTRVSAERMIQLSQAWRLPDGPPVIMLPGRIARSRGHGALIEALALMGQRELRCVFAAEAPAGPGYSKELAGLARQHGMEGRLTIGDDCRDMPAAYMLADVVVYARADGTGFARVVAEAQAMGRPVVAFDSPLLREQTGESRMTWLVPPGDRTALAQAIGEALDLSAAERQALAPEASAIARQHFNRATAAAAMIEIFLDLLMSAKAA